MEIFEHRLTDCDVTHFTCMKNKRRMEKPPVMVVLHYTAGRSCLSSVMHLLRPDVDASAHVVIGRKGEIVQLLPFDIEAWHAGRGWYAGRGELNRCSIGIELDNLGRLEKRGEVYVAECGRVVPPEEVYTHEDGSHWHRYTTAQVAAAQEICRLLRENYPVRYVVGHSDVTGRKMDPGPALAACGFDGYVY